MSIFIFRDYEKYMKSSNRFKSYLISQLNNIRTVIELEDVFIKFKKELLTYLSNKKEIEVTCRHDSYEIKELELELEINDNVSECSTVDLNKESNIDQLNNDDQDDDNQDDDNQDNDYQDDDNQDDDNQDYYNQDNDNKTYLVDSDDSDEESLIEIAMSKLKLKDIKPSDIKKLNNNELRNILRSNGLTVSKNGIYLTKKDLIKKLLSEKKKQIS